MFPLKLFSVNLELEVAGVSFLHGLFVLHLFSTQQTPNTWSAHSLAAVLSLCLAQRVTVASGRCSRSKWPFYPSTLRESVSQIQEVVGLTEVSALPETKAKCSMIISLSINYLSKGVALLKYLERFRDCAN